MQTVQMTLDEPLVQAVDQIVKRIHTTRSAFTRDALRDAIEKFDTLRLERQHRSGYKRQPVASGEFTDWEDEQAWGDA